jgi:hypothetical protein
MVFKASIMSSSEVQDYGASNPRDCEHNRVNACDLTISHSVSHATPHASLLQEFTVSFNTCKVAIQFMVDRCACATLH